MFAPADRGSARNLSEPWSSESPSNNAYASPELSHSLIVGSVPFNSNNFVGLSVPIPNFPPLAEVIIVVPPIETPELVVSNFGCALPS